MKENKFRGLSILDLPTILSIIGLVLLDLPMSSLPAFAQERLIPIAAWSFNRCAQDLSEGHILDGAGRTDPVEGRPNHLLANGASCASLVGREGRFGDAGWFTGGPPAESRAVVPLGDRFTVSAWVYPNPFTRDLGIVSGGGESYALAYNQALNSGRGGFRFQYGGSFIDSRPAPLGNWHHVAAVVGPDPECPGEVLRLRVYVDAVLDASPTVCAQAGDLEETAVVGAGFRGRIDEITLYATNMNQDQVSALLGRPKPVYLGADTSAHAELGHYPFDPDGVQNPLGYDFYLGRIAVGTRLCTIRTHAGRDIFTGDFVPDVDSCSAFEMYAAAVARPQKTYGYVLLRGPNERPATVPSDRAYGAEQARILADQRDRYLHVVYGRTLFADIEDLFGSGWDTGCGSGIVSACERNQEVLEGFLDRAIQSGFTGGVYTSLEIWNGAFGKDYVSPVEFVAWITGWHSSCDLSGRPADGKNVDEETLGEFEQNVLGGMQGVLWQYAFKPLPGSSCPPSGLFPVDFDATRQNPTVRFLPRRIADNPPEAPTQLTATPDANTLRDRWIRLRWDHVREGRVRYNIYRSRTSPVPTDNAHQIASGLLRSRYRDERVNWETTYYYAVTAVDSGGTSSGPSGEASARLVLFRNVQVAPNPFTPDGDGVDDVTRMTYTLALPRRERRVRVSAEILDSGGNFVQRFEVRPPVQGPGRHSVTWDGSRQDGTIAAAGLYTFRITARSTSGRPPAVVRWSGEVRASPCTASVPQDHWRGEYWSNKELVGTPSMVRDDGAGSLDFDWGTGSPSACGIGADDFSARWTRSVNFAAGTHRFTITSDDGFRFYVDGALWLDKWIIQAPTTYTVDVTLSAGDHTLRMDYYENTGLAVAKLSWQSLAVSISPIGWSGEVVGTFTYAWSGMSGHQYWDGPLGGGNWQGTRAHTDFTFENIPNDAVVEVCSRGNLPFKEWDGGGPRSPARALPTGRALGEFTLGSWICTRQTLDLRHTTVISIGHAWGAEGRHQPGCCTEDPIPQAHYDWEVWLKSINGYEFAPPDGSLLESPNAPSAANSDPWLAEDYAEIQRLRPRVLALDFVNHRSMAEMQTQLQQAIDAIAERSRYHSYANGAAPVPGVSTGRQRGPARRAAGVDPQQ